MANDLIAALERAAAQCEKTAAIMAKLLQGPEVQAAIDALEPSAKAILDQDKADAALIRTHIADLCAGNLVRRPETALAMAYECGFNEGVAHERAKVVDWLRDYASKHGGDLEPNLSLNLAADDIASGAHIRGVDADCPPTDAKGDM